MDYCNILIELCRIFSMIFALWENCGFVILQDTDEEWHTYDVADGCPDGYFQVGNDYFIYVVTDTNGNRRGITIQDLAGQNEIYYYACTNACQMKGDMFLSPTRNWYWLRHVHSRNFISGRLSIFRDHDRRDGHWRLGILGGRISHDAVGWLKFNRRWLRSSSRL